MIYIVAGIMGYILGSIPFGLVVTKLAGLGDIRKIGSGNIGATNVLRTGRKDLALLTVIFDVSKAGLAAIIAMHMVDSDKYMVGLVAGAMGVVGHNFPVWLGFKGGKGVASTIGMMIVTCMPAGLCVVGTWFVTALVFRYSSLAALIAISLSPAYGFLFTGSYTFMGVYGALAILCLWRHKDNIKRLINGTESKIKFGKKK